MTLPPVSVEHPHVVLSPEGTPYVRGTRVPVSRLWHWHAHGVLVDTLWKRYPRIPKGHILDALAFGYDNLELIEACVQREHKALEDKNNPQLKLPKV